MQPPTPRVIRLLLVDDEPGVLEAYRVVITRHAAFSIIGTAANGLEAIQRYQDLRPDLVLMDLNMPILGGAEAAASILSRDPLARIVVMTSFGSIDWVVPALQAGATGYLLKTTPAPKLLRALSQAAQGDFPVERDVLNLLVNAVTGTPAVDAPYLTPRERQVLLLLARGMSNSEIADELVVTISTVKLHVGNLASKFGVASRTKIVARAAEANLLPR